MKSLISSLLLAVLVMSCGGGGGSSSSPSTPSVSTPTPSPPPDPEPVIVFNVEIVRSIADYWNPAVLHVEYTVDGIAEPLNIELPEGHYFETPTGIEIYSNGQLGDQLIIINDEEYQLRFEDMPVCEGTREGLTMIDCMGLQQSAGSEWYIYYGEDDTRVVDWDVAYVGRAKGEVDQRLVDEAEQTIAFVNELYEKSGVYVRLRLKQIIGVPNPTGSFNGDHEDVDILMIASGPTSTGACGYAGQVSKFRDRVSPLRPLSACGAMTFAHEIGHSVGLGHGENGGVNGGGGSTFRFAIGSTICGFRSDVMQYGGSNSTKAFSNHKLKCKDMGFLGKYEEDVAGSLQTGSTAYAINRVRYDVALVHDEFAKEPAKFEEFICRKEQGPDGQWRDCYGHLYGGASQSLPWSGPDDLRVAPVQLGLLRRGGTPGEPMPEDHPDVRKFEHYINQINAINIDSGVYIRFVSVGGIWGGDFYGIDQVPRQYWTGKADIAVGWGPADNFGETYVQRSFVPGQVPPAVISTVGVNIMMHELGHVMGLGHGIWGGRFLGGGGFFKDFGHGYSDSKGMGICRYVDTPMSYGNEPLGWSNSERSCSWAKKSPGAFGDARGFRGPGGTDEAYSLNRVRWAVSRISDESSY